MALDSPVLTDFGYHVGLAFQVIDNAFDKTQTSEQLVRPVGIDTKVQKARDPSIVGLEKSRKIAAQLTDKAFAALCCFKSRSVALEALAEFLLKRWSVFKRRTPVETTLDRRLRRG